MEVMQHSSGEHPVLLTKAEQMKVALQLKPPGGKPILVPARLVQPVSQYYEDVSESLANLLSKCADVRGNGVGSNEPDPETLAVELVAGKTEKARDDGIPATKAQFAEQAIEFDTSRLAAVVLSQEDTEAAIKDRQPVDEELAANLEQAQKVVLEIVQPEGHGGQSDSDSEQQFGDDLCGLGNMFDFIMKGIADLVIGSISFKVMIERARGSLFSKVAVAAAVLAIARFAGLLAAMAGDKHIWLLDARIDARTGSDACDAVETLAKRILQRIFFNALPCRFPRSPLVHASVQVTIAAPASIGSDALVAMLPASPRPMTPPAKPPSHEAEERGTRSWRRSSRAKGTAEPSSARAKLCEQCSLYYGNKTIECPECLSTLVQRGY